MDGNTYVCASDLFTEMKAVCDAIESTGLYPFARVTAAGLAFEARQFPKASGYPEDAATGIAATALTGALDFFGIDVAPGRSEERRVGKECVSTCRSRWAQYH